VYSWIELPHASTERFEKMIFGDGMDEKAVDYFFKYGSFSKHAYPDHMYYTSPVYFMAIIV
jgi:hypothetical protein